MVNVRATLARAVEAGVIAAETLPALLAAGKAIHFTERSWPAIWAASPIGAEETTRLAHFVAEHYVDRKKLDALDLLRVVEAISKGERAKPEPVPFEFNATMMFSALYQRDRCVESEGTVLPLYEIAEHAALHRPDFAAINEAALDRALVAVLADLTAVELADGAAAEEASRFRAARGMAEEADFAAWLEANHLDRDGFHDLMVQLARRRRLHLWLLSHKAKEKNNAALLDELRIRGEYPQIAAEAALHHHLCAARPPEEAAELGQLARDHVRDTGIGMTGALSDWAFLAGFHTLEDLRAALLRSKTARRQMRDMLESLDD
jgi:hypothetical protein